jgi:predicted N-acyltransferase
MLPSHKFKMAAYYVKNKKCCGRHLGFCRHFDFLAWQQCFYFYIASELQHIKK